MTLKKSKINYHVGRLQNQFSIKDTVPYVSMYITNKPNILNSYQSFNHKVLRKNTILFYVSGKIISQK